LVLHVFNLLIAAGAFAAYEHFHLLKQTTPALISLVIAAVFALAPVRAILGELWSLESKALHIVHGVGGLGLIGLALGGYVSGGPVLNHAAMAPFEIMGAAQAIMHQQHPRNARQAEALRRFATSLPEVEQFTSARNLTSPDNVARAVRVLRDLISKAQALGATELDADPGFQSALRQVTTHVGSASMLSIRVSTGSLLKQASRHRRSRNCAASLLAHVRLSRAASSRATTAVDQRDERGQAI
jgi:hypothetical protein